MEEAAAERRPDQAKAFLTRLFDDMAKGGDFDLENILEFDGGLFDGRPPLALEHTEIGLLFAAANLDWSLIDPTIFGTLFERFLDPDKRAQIGAHYTDPEKIMMIVEPVVLRPLRAEWEAAKAKIEGIMAPALEGASGNGRAASRDLAKRFDTARAKAEIERDAFIERLCGLRILDPACGSGNFLYLALQGVKDIEWRAVLDCEASASAWRCRASDRKSCAGSRSTHSPPNSLVRRSGSATSNGGSKMRFKTTRAQSCASSTRSNAATRCSRGTQQAALSRLNGRTPISSSATRRFWAASC
jgi:hypothetical protein